MKTVITYGSFDLLHRGHIRLLERAKALGDYLIVGVTSEDFDRSRGKINVQQSLTERVDAIRETGLADRVIVEEYVGQKIDDIRRYDVDIFAIGSDWKGKFDYLNEYCHVVYLDRTKGISSTQLRTKDRTVQMGLAGGGKPVALTKYWKECDFVNGAEVSAIWSQDEGVRIEAAKEDVPLVNSFDALLNNCDAVYISSHPDDHYEQVKKALESGKHVICESPIAETRAQCRELFELADQKGLVLSEALKTAYATAYDRLMLLIKSGRIGRVVSIDSTCTSLREQIYDPDKRNARYWNSITTWGPTAMLPVFQILGTDYEDLSMDTMYVDEESRFDGFTRLSFRYKGAVATVKVGLGAKSEGELVISGTQGYVYVPAPWWKTDYYEMRFEDQAKNKRYFYQLDGEGIRYELVDFVKSISGGKKNFYVDRSVSEEIAGVMEAYYAGKNVTVLG
ncbi:Gfo/Idh/MocA family oxidoreductase [Eubacterium pyruvativorans]|uniref:Gfo/Idh/MocA family oxidoreductase n=1 Tax=Eubacterium pyruvativorans TaxID=155865 RepID=UPI00088F76B5|nr:Gfo/Idh/MocA family oxidoreductase [Eubacterium pyruvativorans]MDO5567816.1 Gfo/Idh/MocA family oxidoreductase [Eubacteriales bacterium]HAT83104.1 glycerol-3-phosphate cytidylyltransferase [Eubacterium sp.]MCI5747397.1 Gfo/Idh/MocA family oxidoreductase [Eubacterium pyruvativorans]MDD6708095.1 Gfo/Idh/MocA family oxidoreductase [Eubacterium pyruvativorans]MDD7684742.1 Gfo/Idh/MocA family oxidoreductase [Eubacterium pyruvativorans]